MKFSGIASCCICLALLQAFAACNRSEPAQLPPAVVLARMCGSVLIGIRNTPDGRFHIWTYDIALGKFDVLASGDDGGRYPRLVPGITPTRIVWYSSIQDDEGLIKGFESIMVDNERKEPVALDFIKHPAGEDEIDVSRVARSLFDSGRYMLVYEFSGAVSRHRVWDLLRNSHSESIPAKEGYFPMWAGPASGIGKGYGVIAESGDYGNGEHDGISQLVLLDVVSMREIGSLTVTEMDLVDVIDAPTLGCIFVLVRSACCHDMGYLRLTADDWEGDKKIDLEDAIWHPDGVYRVGWARDLRFWLTGDGEGEPFVLHMASETATAPQYTSAKLGKLEGPDIAVNYVVSDDASLVATILGGEAFEIRSIGQPEVTLLKRLRIEAREKEDGSFELNLVEESSTGK